MKCLIAISTCYDFETNGSNNAMRETWLPDVKNFPDLEYRFFVGKGQGAENQLLVGELPADMVFLPEVEDGYGTLTYKTKASLIWAHERGYDFIFRCFPDTYVRLDRLMASGFEAYDYFGDFNGNPDVNMLEHGRAQNYAVGGPGYWLSKRAYQLLLDKPVLGIWKDSVTPYTEDLWTGNLLGRTFIGQLPPMDPPLKYFDDRHRFINKGSRYFATKQNPVISLHLSNPDRYSKDKMYKAHEAYLNS